MSSYLEHIKQANAKAGDPITNDAGGTAWKPALQTLVRRYLLTGTTQGSYYVNADTLTDRMVDCLMEAATKDPQMLANEILYCSKHGINNHAPILGLVHLSMGDVPAKTLFKSIFNEVIRTGSHFHEWLAYTKALRGMGYIVDQMGEQWLLGKPVQAITYQMLKYPSRYEFSFKDALRLLKPKTKDPYRSGLFAYVVGKQDRMPPELKGTPLDMVWWLEYLKANPSKGVQAVKEGGLTHEMVAPIAHMNRDVWQALFESMPVEATLRNLGSLTELGVLTYNSRDNLELLRKRLLSDGALAKLHPVNILKAFKVYQSNGRLGRSKKTWNAVPYIVDLLEEVFEKSFETVEPTNKFFFHAVDISGSMSSATSEFGPTAAELAGAMALVTVKTEPHYFVGGFAQEFKPLSLNRKQSFREATEYMRRINMGATNAASAFQYATKHNIVADVFCMWTDNEDWCRPFGVTPSQALAEYREKVNPNAKAVYVSITPNRVTLVDPKDTKSYDIPGFTSEVPALIQQIAADYI